MNYSHIKFILMVRLYYPECYYSFAGVASRRVQIQACTYQGQLGKEIVEVLAHHGCTSSEPKGLPTPLHRSLLPSWLELGQLLHLQQKAESELCTPAVLAPEFSLQLISEQSGWAHTNS